MFKSQSLPRSFFNRDTLLVARELIGKQLVRIENGVRVGGLISETEAYRGETDLASHAKAGRTLRTAVMYGPPGYAYIYFAYGMHWLLNFVTEPENYPAAVLIRGIIPTEGLDIIAERRGKRARAEWTNGPGKVCAALGVSKELNGSDCCSPEAFLFVEAGEAVEDSNVTKGPRVGLNNVPEPWKSIPWRFLWRKMNTGG